MFISILAVVFTVQAPKGGEYYPTRVGAKLTYQTPDGDAVRVVTKVEQQEGANVVTVASVRQDGTQVPSEKVRASPGGLAQLGHWPVQVSFDGSALPDPVWTPNETPVELLRLGAKPGEKWEHSHDGVKTSFTAGRPETVKVPAGEFLAETVKVVRTLPDGRTQEFRYWYAPGVGAVKWTFGPEKGDQIVLKSFTVGGK